MSCTVSDADSVRARSDSGSARLVPASGAGELLVIEFLVGGQPSSRSRRPNLARWVSRLIRRRATDDRTDDLNVLDLVLRHGVRIVRQGNEVREFAGCDRSLERLLMRGIRAVHRIDLERFVDADALI